jgi:ribulose 1,5-bisphosphate carboxylase large subunit-like protein
MGFSAVKFIIEEYRNDALFLINDIGRGILTRPPGFLMSERVLSKLSRLIGADAVYTGPLTQGFPYDVEILKDERASLQ